jgi:DNA-binding transcriptional ArsR family regulator
VSLAVHQSALDYVVVIPGFGQFRHMDVPHRIDAFGALAPGTRLQVFDLLPRAGRDSLPAGEVARRPGTAHDTMSTHLAILSRAALARPRRASRHVVSAPEPDTVRGVVAFLVQACCGGQPERCAALLAAAMPVSSCQPGCAA